MCIISVTSPELPSHDHSMLRMRCQCVLVVIRKRYAVAVVAVDKAGRVGAACHGWTFKYSVRAASMDDVQVGK